MTLDKLIDRINDHYPGDMVAQYWAVVSGGKDAKKSEKAKELAELGDTLALFIVNEISDTFDDEATDEEQLQAAADAIGKAADELLTVAGALEELI